MSEQISGDLLDIQSGILVHQVNLAGVMGAGLAKQIKDKWPFVYAMYHDVCYSDLLHLGDVLLVGINPVLYVANFAGQDLPLRGGHPTFVSAYSPGWQKIVGHSHRLKMPVYAPWMIGCGLGGGNWNVIKPLVESICPNVTWVKYG